MIREFPHCDQRILHAPGECEFCDERSVWQELREAWGICFTGHQPADWYILPCPADFSRPPGSASDHRRWGGNRPTSARDDDPNWPEETWASRLLYGWNRNRASRA